MSSTPSVDPPSLPSSLGFPSGYFVIRSLATGRLWDVSGMSKDDGAVIHLWKEKELSLVEKLRDPIADNQIFFIDYTGALCSKPSGHAVDIEDGRVVLRHRRPMIHPFPNTYSHPLPRFAYDPSTGHIEVRFATNPAYPPPTPSPSMAWKEKHYIMTSVPMRAPPSLAANAAAFFSNTASLITGPFEQRHAPTPSDEFDLREDEVMEEERGAENEADDSAELGRDLQMITLPLGWSPLDGSAVGNARARERRRFEIVPLLKDKVKYK